MISQPINVEEIYQKISDEESLETYISFRKNSESYPVVLFYKKSYFVALSWDIIYSVPSLVSGLDICFKCYKVFRIPFRTLSEMFWTFMERGFYRITENSAYLNSIIAEYIAKIEQLKESKSEM